MGEVQGERKELEGEAADAGSQGGTGPSEVCDTAGGRCGPGCVQCGAGRVPGGGCPSGPAGPASATLPCPPAAAIRPRVGSHRQGPGAGSPLTRWRRLCPARGTGEGEQGDLGQGHPVGTEEVEGGHRSVREASSPAKIPNELPSGGVKAPAQRQILGERNGVGGWIVLPASERQRGWLW